MAGLEDYRWLVSPSGVEAIQSASELLQAKDVFAATTLLRRIYSPSQTHLALEQAQLRVKARGKFSHADRIFFTDVALQQATSETIACYKASRFPVGKPIHDLCCGIGGDLLALASRAPAVGVERDEVTSLLASANCQALGLDNASIEQRDVTSLSPADMPLVHIDPDRRPQGRRTTRVELHEPGEAFLESLIEHCEGGAIKLAPAAQIPDGWNAQVEQEWISDEGECKQLIVWLGSLVVQPGRKVATALSSDGSRHESFTAEEDKALPIAAEALGDYIYEPDPAVIAAGLVSEIAAQEGLSQLSAGVAYLTGDVKTGSPMLTAFEVIDQTAMDIKRVKAMLIPHDVGRIEIKKRGVDVQPEQLQRQLKTDGAQRATLIITPLNGRAIAVLTQRLTK